MSIRNIITNIFLIALSVTICLWILELYFRYTIKWNKANPTVINLPIFEKSNLRSWNLKPNTKAFHGFWNPVPEISINSIWLRNEEIPIEKTKDRILMLWDSFVFGMWAHQNETMSEILNTKYFWEKYTRVINAWVIWQTIDDAYVYLKNDWLKLGPDTVIYNFFVWNDITELRRHTHEYDKTWDIIKVVDQDHFVNKEWYLRKKWKKEPKSYLLYWINLRLWNITVDPFLTWPVFLSDDSPEWDPNIYKYWWKFIEILDKMHKLTSDNNIKFYVNIIPMDVQVSDLYWHKYPWMPFGKDEFEAKRPQTRIKALLKEKNINYIDLLPTFQDVNADLVNAKNWQVLFFKEDPHFNMLWHMWAANTIYLQLTKNNK